MRRYNVGEQNKKLPFRPKFYPPPMPQNYILADPCGPIAPIPLNQENPHYNKTGIITRVDNDHRLIIDQMYVFHSPCYLGMHKVNDYVLYECYDGPNGALVIVKIERNYGRFRARPDAEQAVASGQHNLIDQFDHLLIGQVEDKPGNEILIKSNLSSPDNAKANVVPEEGNQMQEEDNSGHDRHDLNRQWEAVTEQDHIRREKQAASDDKPPRIPPLPSRVVAITSFLEQQPDYTDRVNAKPLKSQQMREKDSSTSKLLKLVKDHQ